MRKILAFIACAFAYGECNISTWESLFPNLSGCALSGANLSGNNFDGADLSEADLSDTNLTECSFVGTDLSGASLDGAVVWNTSFSGALMCGVDTGLINGAVTDQVVTEEDCFGECGGSGELDSCGVCDGDGSACYGCTDPFATNYSSLAIYDDGSCEYYEGEVDGNAPSVIWTEHVWDEDCSFENDVDVPNYSEPTWTYEDNFKCVESFNGGVTCSGFYYSYLDGCWSYNIFVYELDIDGNMIWFKDYGNWENDGGIDCHINEYTRGIIKDDEGYYVYGEMSASTPSRGYILKLDPNGNQIWVRYVNLYESDIENTDYLYGGLSASNGNLIFVGGGFMPSVGYEAGIWIMDSDGNNVASFNYHIEQPNGDNDGEHEYLYDVIETSDGNYVAVGTVDVQGGVLQNARYPLIIKFNESGIISTNYIYEVFSGDFYHYPKLVEIDNGNLLIAGTNNSDHATLIVTNSQGEYIAHTSDHFGFEISDGDSYAFDIINTIDNKIIVLGTAVNGFAGWDLFSFKMDQEMNVEWVYHFGNYFGSTDWGHGIIQLSDNTLVLSGWGNTIHQDQAAPFVIRTHFQDGCMDNNGCNYNPYASYDNGSCVYEDACDTCYGNGYDFCDDNGNGINNLEEWGYGAYGLSASDAPDDQGGKVLLTFSGSFYDTDGLSRSELYTIELLDGETWTVAQTVGAYGADTYTAIVPTLYDAQETEFRVIANMDEGNFLCLENAVAASIDNLAPSAPEFSGASFDDGDVSLEWSAPEDADFSHFRLLRDGELIAMTASAGYTDQGVPNTESLLYELSALDHSGNESGADSIEVGVHLMGDLNDDYLLNVLDIVMLVESIVLSGECSYYGDINQDGACDVLDVVLLAGIVLELNSDE